jgi:uncharacterized protein
MSGAMNELPMVFECQGERLIGMIHQPARPSSIGVLTIVAGGPQYRGGCGRQLVNMARELCDAGFAVMRFDYRGLGDSEGQFRGFTCIEEDIRAAITAFRRQLPELERIVLWGGCDAASASLINAWRFPEVAGVVLANPFVTSEATQAAVMKQHYLKRLTERSFWQKLARFEYDYSAYAKSAWARLTPATGGDSGNSAAQPQRGDFLPLMLEGLHKFEGHILFLMSGKSLVSREFDAMLAGSRVWSDAYSSATKTRVDLPDADQAFTNEAARAEVNRAVKDWLATVSPQLLSPATKQVS